MSALPTNNQEIEDKGKGKSVAENVEMSMDEDETSADEDYEEEEPVDPNVMEEDDGLDEIDPSNIIQGGRRTRGKVIDFAKAAAENPADEDDEDDDEDFESNNMEED